MCEACPFISNEQTYSGLTGNEWKGGHYQTQYFPPMQLIKSGLKILNKTYVGEFLDT